MMRSVASNSLMNVLGQGLPLLVAIFTIPLVIAGLGNERFGLLSVGWLITGYFSLFDLGLGRALTQVIAKRRAVEPPERLKATIWAGLLAMLLLGLVGALLATALAPWLAHSAFKLSPALTDEAQLSFYLLALSIPVVIVTAGLVGVLTAYERFDFINLVRIPLGISNFVVPVLVMPFSKNIGVIIGFLILSRLLAAIIQLYLCFRVLPQLKRIGSIAWRDLTPLLRLGGWMTVSNVVGPMMVYLDRFLIGGIISVAAVAFYATPYDIVTKILIIPTAITAALFPLFSRVGAAAEVESARLFAAGLNIIFVLVFPGVLLLIVFAPQLLHLWLGVEFAQKSAAPTQWLALGIFLNSLAQLPFALLQGRARADLTAKSHLAQLIVYLPLLLLAMQRYGLVGAAAMWALRAAADCLILFVLSNKLAAGLAKSSWSSLIGVGLAVVCLGVTLVLSDLSHRLLATAGFIPLLTTYYLKKMLTAEERKNWLSRLDRIGFIKKWRARPV